MKIACVTGALAALACSALAHVLPAEDAQHAFSVMNVDGESASFKLEPNDALDLTVDDDELNSEHTGNFPRGPRVPRVVTPLLQELSLDRMLSFLKNFTSFYNRYHDGPDGVDAAEFLYDQVTALADQSLNNITVRRFEHSWQQFSIIARFEPMDTLIDTSNNSAVVLCAHLDSSNSRNVYGRAPGADLGGSGAATILEVFRVLSQGKNYNPTRPVEFHWYSAFDGGLLGSRDIAEYYKANDIKIHAMMETERTGFIDIRGNANRIDVSTKYTNPELSRYIENLVVRYVPDGYIQYFACESRCGDHVSWNSTGFPIINTVDHMSWFTNYRTETDTVDRLSFAKMRTFVRLALSFAAELGLAP